VTPGTGRGAASLPAGPIDEPPYGVLPRGDDGSIGPDASRAAIERALRGVLLGAYDDQMIRWLLNMCDEADLVTVCSLIERARAAAVAEASTSARSTPKSGRPPLADLPMEGTPE
jgi:hypothetical protein